MLVTRMPRDSRIAAREAAAMPFPREETTPPVTNTYFVIDPRRVGMEEFTGTPAASQTECASTGVYFAENGKRGHAGKSCAALGGSLPRSPFARSTLQDRTERVGKNRNESGQQSPRQA